MPGMDGYTACDEILALADRTSKLPFIFLTKVTAKHLNALGTELGAYLRKPVTDQQLLATVEALLDGCEEGKTCAGSSQ